MAPVVPTTNCRPDAKADRRHNPQRSRGRDARDEIAGQSDAARG